MKTIQNIQVPSAIDSIRAVADMGGDYLEIRLATGAVIHIAADNDAIRYYAPNNQPESETCENPTAWLVTALGGGHCDSPNDITVMVGSNTDRFNCLPA